MKRKAARLIIITMMVCIAISVSSITSASASSHTHKYKTGTDYCSTCGYYRIHETSITIPCYTRTNSVPVWSKPNSSSKKIKTLSANKPIDIIGRTRNEHKNLWLKTSDGYYIYYENLVINLDNILTESKAEIFAIRKGVSKEASVADFFINEYPNGIWDLKTSLGNSSGESYYTRIGGKVVMLSGEDIGNIHYGFVGRYTGFSSNTLLVAGGIANIYTSKSSIFTKYLECIISYCDDPADVKYVKKGISYYETGKY